MPVIARFYGITIKMYFRQAEHNPPHIHVSSGECVGLFSIHTGDMFEGDLSPKDQQMVKTFIDHYRERLLTMWENQDFEMLSSIQ